MTSPRDEDMPDRLVDAAKGIRKEWRVLASGDREDGYITGDRAKAAQVASLWNLAPELIPVRVESRHVTPWQPDPGVGVTDVARKGKASDVDTPTPATVDFPPEWIAEHGSGVDL